MPKDWLGNWAWGKSCSTQGHWAVRWKLVLQSKTFLTLKATLFLFMLTQKLEEFGWALFCNSPEIKTKTSKENLLNLVTCIFNFQEQDIACRIFQMYLTMLFLRTSSEMPCGNAGLRRWIPKHSPPKVPVLNVYRKTKKKLSSFNTTFAWTNFLN